MKRASVIFFSVLVILLVAVGIALLGYFTSWYTDWTFKCFKAPPTENVVPSEPQEPVVIEKQLEKTIIENETYGTFELPYNYFKTLNIGAGFAEGTKVSYLVDDVVDFYQSLGMDIFSTDTAKIGFDTGGSNAFYFAVNGEGSEIAGIAMFKNDIVSYKENHKAYETVGAELLIFDVEKKQSNDAVFFVYCQSVEYFSTQFNSLVYAPEVIISDIGVPLTDGIYKKLMADESTIITYVYKQ